MASQPAAGKNMRYVRVRWVHDDPYEPIDLYYELKEDHWAARVIEVYGDGSMEQVDPNLMDAPLPPLKDINAMPEYKGTEISKEAFETVWKKMLESNRE